MKTLMSTTALSLLLVAGGAVAQETEQTDESFAMETADEQSSGVESLPPTVEETVGTDVEGPDAATADEGTLGGGRGTVATAPVDTDDDPGTTTRFLEEYYDLGYRERDGYIWEDGEFLTDEEGNRVPVERAGEYERDTEGRFVVDDEGRMLRREDVAEAPSDVYEEPGQTTQFLEDYYDLGYEERDGMLFEDDEQLTDAEGRPITTETYQYYETDEDGRLATDGEGEYILREDAPNFTMSDEGEMKMDRS